MRSITVKYSVKLLPEQKTRLEKGFRAKYKDEEIFFLYEVDNLIGGIVVIDGDTVYDASIDTDLYKYRARAEGFIVHKEGLNTLTLPMLLKENMDDLLHIETSKGGCGRVIASSDGIITVEGLSDCRYYELLTVGKNKYAVAMNLMQDHVKAMLISADTDVEYGDYAYTTGRIVEVPVGNELLGRVIDPLGQALDGKGEIHFDRTAQIERPAPPIIDRKQVSRPLETGILAIDSMVPIGKGQRELIIGDRQTGKSSIAVDAIINQRGKDVICIYVAIGQRASSVNSVMQKLLAENAMRYTVIVSSAADDPAALQYIAPYTGCTIGEEFMKEGKDVLIVYDDLTKHANAYRTISLLLKRPSGREAYPGDIFYIHSRLLERSGQLSDKKGGGSMTALPIIETLAGDISQYIPTNVISITDGQIYLESELFNAGIRPAVNVGLSVSRVGGAAQHKGVRKLSSKLRLDLAHFREMALFMQFGADVDDATKKVLDHGEKVTELLKQPDGSPMCLWREIIYLYLVGKDLSKIPKSHIVRFVDGFCRYFENIGFHGMKEIAKTGDFSEQTKKFLDEELANFEIFFLAEHKI